MDLDLTENQLALRETVGSFFANEAPISAVRAAEPLGFDAGLWAKVTDMGLATITVPEALGGGGCGFVDLGVVIEELGRSLAPVPLVEAAVANHLLASLVDFGDGAAGAVLDRAVNGTSLVTLALRPAERHVATCVPAGAIADAVVVLDGDELVLQHRPGISPRTPGTHLSNLGAMPVADCRVDQGNRVVIARGPDAVDAHRGAVASWELLTGVALVGLGARALELGLEYVMERRAFGVLIGSFQTIQHRLADNVTALDGARLLAYEAAWAKDVGAAGPATLATMAFLFAGETSFKTAADSLQFHGGYGYTLEYDIQLFFRRAKAWALVAGDPRAPSTRELAHRIYRQREATEVDFTVTRRPGRAPRPGAARWCDANVDPAWAHEQHRPAPTTPWSCIARLARDGILGAGWPAEYGGTDVEPDLATRHVPRDRRPRPAHARAGPRPT